MCFVVHWNNNRLENSKLILLVSSLCVVVCVVRNA